MDEAIREEATGGDAAPESSELDVLESIDVEALAADEVAGLELDMMDLEPEFSAPEEASAVEAEARAEPTVEATAEEEPTPEPVADKPATKIEDEGPVETAATTTSGAASAPSAEDGTETEKERERISHIVFRIDEKRYAVEMQRLLELDRMTPVTPVPHTPEFILGVTNLRGEIVSVIDLRRLFGMPSMDRPETGRLLKLRDRRDLLVSGVLVDAIQGARTIKPEQIKPATSDVGPQIARLLEGVCEDGGEALNVLDVDKLFESEQVRTLTGA